MGSEAVDQHHHALGEADGAQRVRHGKLLDLADDAGLAADARRVPQLDLLAAPLEL